VVAHPPCGPWGKLRHLSKNDDWRCAPKAVQQVRRYGGVLEHPANSLLWPTVDLPYPGELPDAWNGRTIEVCQCDWGHPARKRTWLYIVGVPLPTLFPPAREPTHWVSGSRTAPRGPVPAGIKVCSAQQRRRTPIAFRDLLLSLARAAGEARSGAA
jgi:hypothetical protein